MNVRHSITLPSIFFSVEPLFNFFAELQHVVTLLNLKVSVFGMLYIAGLGQHAARHGGNLTKHTSSLPLHEISKRRQTAESKVTLVQPFCEVDGRAGQLQLPEPCS
jgi:hypothetical protein